MDREEGIQLLKTSTEVEQELCETVKGLFSAIFDSFMFQHNETILSLHYCKLIGNADYSTEV